jgi:hypothetical protein
VQFLLLLSSGLSQRRGQVSTGPRKFGEGAESLGELVAEDVHALPAIVELAMKRAFDGVDQGFGRIGLQSGLVDDNFAIVVRGNTLRKKIVYGVCRLLKRRKSRVRFGERFLSAHGL